MALPVKVTSGYKLPGAILLMAVTTLATTNVAAVTYNVIAYDPLLVANDTIAVIRQRYVQHGLPYFERFTEPTKAEVDFKVKNGSVFYSGVFGTTAAERSLPWTFWVAGDIISGVHLSYWNQEFMDGSFKRTPRGILTAAPLAKFTSSGVSSIMNLYPSKGENILDPVRGMPLGLAKITITWYATHVPGGIAALNVSAS